MKSAIISWAGSYISKMAIPYALYNKNGYELQSLDSYEPPRDKTNKMVCVPSEDSDQPGRLPSLIRVFAVQMTKTLGP